MPAAGWTKRTYTGHPPWHERPAYIDPDERRERYEARLALDWCRSNGNPHLRSK